MTLISDSVLRNQLDRLERKTRIRFLARARRIAADQAAAGALRVSVVVPVAAVVAWVLGLPLSKAVAMLVAIAVPCVAFGLIVGWRISRTGLDRLGALALADRRLGLVDRAVISCEFLDAPNRDGFRDAALQEAGGVLAVAADRPIADAGRPPVASRRAAPFGVAACGLLLLTLVLPAGGGVVVHDPRGDPAGAVAAHRIDAVAAMASWASALTRTLRLTPFGRGGDGGGRASRTIEGDGSGGADDRPPGIPEGMAAGVTRAGARRTGQGGGQGDGVAPGVGATPDGATGPDAAERRGPTPEEGRIASDAGRPASPAATEATPPIAARQAPTAMPPSSTGWPGNAVPQPLGRPAAPRESGGAQGSRRSGSQNSRSGSQGGKQGDGQANGGSSGQDAVKRSRGVAGLLLAVPMEDKLVGTPNAGPARSGLRQGPHSTPEATVTEADDRGEQNGAAGLAAHRPATLQDDRLVSAYFNRSGAAERMR